MNNRAALSLGEMAMFTAYLLVGILIFTAALNIYESTYDQSARAKLMAACNSLVEIADTAWSTGHSEVEVSKEFEQFDKEGINVLRGDDQRELVFSTRKHEVSCYTHAVPRINIDQIGKRLELKEALNE